MNEMDTPFYCEHTYTPRAEGTRLLIKILAIIGYIAFVALSFLAVYYTRIIPLFALCPLVLWILVYFTWPYISYDYYFEYQRGTLTVGTVTRRRHRICRIPKLAIQVNTAEKIYPLGCQIEKPAVVKRYYDFSASKASDRRIVILFENNGEMCMCLFECTQALAKILRHYSWNCDEFTDFVKRL